MYLSIVALKRRTVYPCIVVERQSTHIFDAESLDFIVSVWHQVSQSDREVTSIICVIHIVRPVLFTLVLRSKRNAGQTNTIIRILLEADYHQNLTSIPSSSAVN